MGASAELQPEELPELLEELELEPELLLEEEEEDSLPEEPLSSLAEDTVTSLNSTTVWPLESEIFPLSSTV